MSKAWIEHYASGSDGIRVFRLYGEPGLGVKDALEIFEDANNCQYFANEIDGGVEVIRLKSFNDLVGLMKGKGYLLGINDLEDIMPGCMNIRVNKKPLIPHVFSEEQDPKFEHKYHKSLGLETVTNKTLQRGLTYASDLIEIAKDKFGIDVSKLKLKVSGDIPKLYYALIS